MLINKTVVRLSNRSAGLKDRVENGILAVWPLTLSVYSMVQSHAEFRLQRDVVVASKFRR